MNSSIDIDLKQSTKRPTRVTDSPFIKACYGKNDGMLPVWIMRQAGRYLAEYRAVRERVSFIEVCRTPELVAQVTIDPVKKFSFDAAILFSDILLLLEPLGLTVTYEEGGPTVMPPIKSTYDIERLEMNNISSEMSDVFEGIKEIKSRLPMLPLIGFAGSPFTLACYAIEGRGSKDFNSVKRFMYANPSATDKLLNKLTDATIEYFQGQVAAGVDAVQIFDSWGGILATEEYWCWSLKYIEHIWKALSVTRLPRILFVNNVSPYLHLLAEIDCEVIGVDYRADLSLAAGQLKDKSIQGNLDPNILFGSVDEIRRRTRKMLDSLQHLDNLIVNLGHGILPQTPEQSVAAFVDAVHSYRKEANR